MILVLVYIALPIIVIVLLFGSAVRDAWRARRAKVIMDDVQRRRPPNVGEYDSVNYRIKDAKTADSVIAMKLKITDWLCLGVFILFCVVIIVASWLMP